MLFLWCLNTERSKVLLFGFFILSLPPHVSVMCCPFWVFLSLLLLSYATVACETNSDLLCRIFWFVLNSFFLNFIYIAFSFGFLIQRQGFLILYSIYPNFLYCPGLTISGLTHGWDTSSFVGCFDFFFSALYFSFKLLFYLVSFDVLFFVDFVIYSYAQIFLGFVFFFILFLSITLSW